MIFPAIIIALLLCAETEAGGIPIKECEKWACFAPGTCVGLIVPDLQYFDHNRPIPDECEGILMIRPDSTSRWEVVLGSKKTVANEVKLLQDATELFSCKYDGTKAELTSTMDDKKEVASPFLPNACHFIVDRGSSEVIEEKNERIEMDFPGSSSGSSTMKDKDLLSDVNKKIMCDRSHVKFENSTDSDVIEEPADVQFDSVSCSNSSYKLQYKSDSGYKDVTIISCKKEGDVYKYKIDEKLMDSEFRARCAVKVCSLCTKQPKTPADKTPPTLGDDKGCKTLTCPNSLKFFKIQNHSTSAVYTAVKDQAGKEVAFCITDGDGSKWKIGDTTVEDETEVECVDKIPCKNVTCSNTGTGTCSTEASVFPKCKEGTLTLNIDKTKSSIGSVWCDDTRGKLRYKNGTESHDVQEGATFVCDKKKAEPKVAAAGFGEMTPLHACLGVATLLTLFAIAGSAYVTIRRRMKQKQEGEGKTKKTEEN